MIMNYREALEKKNEIGEFIQEKDLKMNVIVSPNIEDDFVKFVDYFRVLKFDNKSCLSYTEDNQFKVVGLWTDGANVLHKTL